MESRPASRNQAIACAIAFIVIAILAFLFMDEKSMTIAIHQNVEGVALKKIIARFAKEKGVSVEVAELPYDQLYQYELDDVTGAQDHKYDVIMMDDPWMPAMMETKKSKEIKKSTEPPNLLPIGLDARAKDFVKSTLKVCRRDVLDENGELFAVPFVGNSQLFMHRIDDKRPRRTWSDVVRNGYIMRVGAGNQIVTDFLAMVHAEAGTSFTEKSIRFDSNSIGAFMHLAELSKNGVTSLSIISHDDFDLAVQLIKNKASSSIIWSAWAMAMAKLPPGDDGKAFLVQVEFAPLPGGKPLLGAWLLGIPRLAPHPDLAREFVEFATRREQIIDAALAGNPPPLESVLKFDIPDSDMKQRMTDAFGRTFPHQLESLETAQPRPRTPKWKEIETALGDCLSRLYESAISPQEAMTGANKAIDAITANKPVPGPACKSASKQ